MPMFVQHEDELKDKLGTNGKALTTFAVPANDRVQSQRNSCFSLLKKTILLGWMGYVIVVLTRRHVLTPFLMAILRESLSPSGLETKPAGVVLCSLGSVLYRISLRECGSRDTKDTPPSFIIFRLY